MVGSGWGLSYHYIIIVSFMYKVGNVVSFGGVEELVGFFGSVFGLIFFFFVKDYVC